jgi:hypothetical protein
MSWQAQLKGDPLSWLLAAENPSARHLALRDLLDLPPDDPQLTAARTAAHRDGPIAALLENMADAGYWVKPGPGYTTKYRGTVWSVIALAQLGASVDEDPRIATACAYLLDHNLTRGGLFSTSTAPSGTVDCLQGNLCWALLELGCRDPRLEAAFDWLARSQTGEGIAPASERDAAVRYYAYKCGPAFACGANGGFPCAWGAVKVMLALGKWPATRRTPAMERAIARGIDFLLSVDPALAAYPTRTGAKPSRDWWKFGFPVFYVTDLLQNVEALVVLGLGHDPRLARSIQIVLDKQDADGRWALEYDYADKTWVDFGPKSQPNPWVTIRTLRVLKAIG